jgi:hypothetical protein
MVHQKSVTAFIALLNEIGYQVVYSSKRSNDAGVWFKVRKTPDLDDKMYEGKDKAGKDKTNLDYIKSHAKESHDISASNEWHLLIWEDLDTKQFTRLLDGIKYNGENGEIKYDYAHKNGVWFEIKKNPVLDNQMYGDTGMTNLEFIKSEAGYVHDASSESEWHLRAREVTFSSGRA